MQRADRDELSIFTFSDTIGLTGVKRFYIPGITIPGALQSIKGQLDGQNRRVPGTTVALLLPASVNFPEFPDSSEMFPVDAGMNPACQ
jgi:hypothetical protein